MTKISSSGTWFHKVGFPVLWFGFIAIFLGIGVFSGAIVRDPMFLVVPVVMAIFGYFLVEKLVWDLASSIQMNPPRVTLRLVRPGKFGEEVAFSPVRPFTLNPFARIPAVEDLIVRVDRARSERTV